MAKSVESHLRCLSAGHFFGRNARLAEAAGFVLSEVRYEPGQKVPPHGHELGYFCLLTRGGYWEQYGTRRVTYAPSSIVFHPPGGEHHGNIGSRGGSCFNIEISSRRIERLRDLGPCPAAPVDFHGGDLVWLASRLYREFRHADAASPLTIEGLGLEMLGCLLRRTGDDGPTPPRWLRAARERLHDELVRPLSTDAIAADLGVGPVRLARSFRRLYGESMGACLRRLRVERACRLLDRSDAALADIAADLGFADQSHFTRVFKRQTGLTPGQYRRLGGR